MLTPEQIKNLKPGDKLALSYPLIFREYDSENDELLAINNGEYICFHAVDVELPADSARTFCHVVDNMVKPKHDPTRPYQKGDRAQVVERNGRTPTCFPVGRIKVGDIVTVAENEAGDMFIKVLTEDGHEMMVPWFMLELVTPVEDLAPYLMLENVPSNSVEVRDKRTNKVEATFYFGKDHAYTFEQAATRAEAERDRLNAEWRKEQSDD